MAIIKTLDLANGLTAKGAYIRIDAFSGSKMGITYSVNSYVSREAFLDGAPYIDQELLHMVPDCAPTAPPLLAQLYDHLLLQDRYAKAKAA